MTDRLNEYLTHPDVDWTYHRIMDSFDRDAFDKRLVRIGHPLAYEPGTNEHRFKTLARSGYQFPETE